MARASDTQAGLKDIITDSNGDAQQAIIFKDQIDGEYVVHVMAQEADDEAQFSVSGKTSSGFNIEVDNASEQQAEAIDTSSNTITFNDSSQEVIDTTGNTVTFLDNRVESIDASANTLTFVDNSQEVINTTTNTIIFWDNRFELIDTTGNTVTFWDAGTEVIDSTGNTLTFVDNRVESIDTSANTLTFTASTNTILRTTGDWTDKFAAGDVITIATSGSNDGVYTIVTAVALTLTLDGGIANETATVPTITFTHNNTPTASKPTLTRATGDWTTRFVAGDIVTISNSTSNNAAFTIDTVVALTITFLIANTITDEVQTVANNVTFVITTPTISSTTTRASGDWTTTFTAGDVVTWTNSTSNNRAYTILSVTALVITWTVADSILLVAETQTTANNLTGTIADPQVKPTVTRASGSWADRFVAGDTVTFSNTTSNNFAYTVDTVSALILTLDVDDTVTNETQTVATNLTAVITTPTIGDTLTRTTGDWTLRFDAGDTFTIASTTSGNNDGAFTLTAVSALVVTFTPATDSITAESEVAATCTFTVTTPTKSPTITRTTGDWTDRFAAGDTITISNSTSNNGAFTIIAGGVSATVISLIVADVIAAEVQSVANNLTLVISTPTKKPWVVRASGDWGTYFTAGDTITFDVLTGDVNEGTYTIFSISTVTMTLALTDSLTQATETTTTAIFSISNQALSVGWIAIPITQET